MRRSAWFVCVFTLLATPAAAQATTEDGIRAMLRGDYRAAARILRPLADDADRPDPVAQFFLATLYDTGHGVVPDQARACGLFLRAARGTHPISDQSAAIAASKQQQLGSGVSLLCVADERWRGGPPQSFMLGPDHRIVFADTSISVAYGDKEQRTLLLLPRDGMFLPIQHTTLAVTSPAAARRHFFQWFFWMPDKARNPSSWTLAWTLSEVVEDQWIGIASEQNLVVVNGTAPPPDDPADLVRVRVNARGQAEFTIVGGPVPRTEVIPLQGSR